MIITTLTCMCVDIFDNTIMPGGESLNFAATISRLTDAKVYIIGAVGNDSYGKTVLDSIKDFNIDKPISERKTEIPPRTAPTLPPTATVIIKTIRGTAECSQALPCLRLTGNCCIRRIWCIPPFPDRISTM